MGRKHHWPRNYEDRSSNFGSVADLLCVVVQFTSQLHVLASVKWIVLVFFFNLDRIALYSSCLDLPNPGIIDVKFM